MHDLLPLYYPREYPRQQYYFRYYVPAVLKRSRAIITISEASRQDIVRVYRVPPEKVHVALCGYDARRFSPYGPAFNATGYDQYALYVGNVMPHKNLERLVRRLRHGSRAAAGPACHPGLGKAPSCGGVAFTHRAAWAGKPCGLAAVRGRRGAAPTLSWGTDAPPTLAAGGLRTHCAGGHGVRHARHRIEHVVAAGGRW